MSQSDRRNVESARRAKRMEWIDKSTRPQTSDLTSFAKEQQENEDYLRATYGIEEPRKKWSDWESLYE